MKRLVGVLLAIAVGLAPGRMAAQRVAPPRMAMAPSVDEPAGAPSRRSPLVAGALGFILPGGGHFYAGEARRGWAVFGVTMVGAFFALSDGTPRAVATAGAVVFVGGWVFSVVDGSLAAQRYNRRQ